MIRVIDKSETHLIQKVTAPSGAVIGYQASPKGSLGNAAEITRVSTLAEARKIAGLKITPKE